MKILRVISAILYFIAGIFSLVGASFFMMSLNISKNAIQESSGSTMAVAIAVIPYCGARCFDLFLSKLKDE
jgi:uncharacterized membrane protein